MSLRHVNFSRREERRTNRRLFDKSRIWDLYSKNLAMTSISNITQLTEERLFIIQYNAHRSKDNVMTVFLIDLKMLKYDIIALQKSWRNNYQVTTHFFNSRWFNLIYVDQTNIESKKLKICFYINKRIDQIKIEIHFHSRDILTLEIRLESSNSNLIHSIWIRNVYNESNVTSASTLIKLQSILRNRTRYRDSNLNDFIEDIIIENLNIHHSQWDDLEIKLDNRSHELLDIIDKFKLTQHVSQRARTYILDTYDTSQILDLCFTTQRLVNRVLHCNVREDVEQNSNHYSVSTELNLNIAKVSTRDPLCWDKIDLSELKEIFEVKMKNLNQSNLSLNDMIDKNTINRITKIIVAAIDYAMKTAMSRIIISRHSKLEWIDECKQACAETQKRRCLYQQIMSTSTSIHLKKAAKRRWRKVDHKKKKLIDKTLRITHREKMKKFSDNMNKVWKLVKWAKNRDNSYKSYTLTLTNAQEFKIIEKKQKTTLLIEFFFSKLSNANLSNIQDFQYFDSIRFEKLKNHELMNIIKNVSKEKTSKDDEMNNRALVALLLTLIFILRQLFKACLKIEYCSAHFRRSMTISFKKFEKELYSILKTYRSIALLSIIDKTLKSILTNRLTWATKEHELLSNLHLEERKSISSEVTIHTLMKRIHVEWKKKLISSLLLLNVSETFDNVSHRRLLHNLRKRRIDDAMLDWIESFISKKQIKLRLSNYTFDWMNTNIDISQSSLLSLILYLFYNANLLNTLNDDESNSIVVEYIDDIAILVTRTSQKKNIKKLRKLHDRVLDWFKKHVFIFDLKKYQLVHFHDRNSKEKKKNIELDCNFELLNVTIKTAASCKYLEVTIDKQLKWDLHMNQMKTKTTKRLIVLQTLSDSTLEIDLKNMRKVYQKIILSLFLYCVFTWYVLPEEWEYAKNQHKTLKTLRVIQRRVA